MCLVSLLLFFAWNLNSNYTYFDRDYKELIAKRNELVAKCDLLEKGDARYSKKLEKAKEKIVKLKVST